MADELAQARKEITRQNVTIQSLERRNAMLTEQNNEMFAELLKLRQYVDALKIVHEYESEKLNDQLRATLKKLEEQAPVHYDKDEDPIEF